MKQGLTLVAFFWSYFLYAQSSYIIPQTYVPYTTYKIYIDIEKACDTARIPRFDTYLKADTNRYEDVYIWLWSPDTPVGVGGNGEWWGNSNPLLKMTHVSNLLFSYTFSIEDLFNISPQNFTNKRISFLAKTKDGSAQTEDQTIYLWNVSVDPAPSEAIQLYPIPAREQITIAHPTPGMAFEIVDLSGKQVFSEKNPFQAETTIDTHTWQPGMYLLSYPGTGQKRHFVVE